METNRIQLAERPVEIQYLQAGQDGKTLVFLHGWSIHSGYWEDQLAHFSNSHTAYAPDLPGFGGSTAERADWTVEAFAEDFVAFLAALDLKEVVLIGHSMGGAVMLEVAIRAQERIQAVVGVDNFQFVDVEMDGDLMSEMVASVQRMAEDYPRYAPAYADQWLFQTTTPEAVRARIRQDFATANPAVAFPVLTQVMQYFGRLPDRLEDLPFPLHLINSAIPPAHTEGLERRCRHGYHLRTVGPTGHYPMVEAPAAFNEQLEALLETL